MTAQVHEMIIIDGKKTSMAFCPPLPIDDPRIKKASQNVISSSCWRGYIGSWEIKSNQFFLTGLSGKYELCENVPVFAEWFSGTLVVPEGEMLEYVHGGFATVFEREQRINIENGVIVSSFTIDNRPAFRDSDFGNSESGRNLSDLSIRDFLKYRGVEHVIHFTQAENLPSILQHGLQGRDSLHAAGVDALVNDFHRFDLLPDSICCSISFPNYKMFYQMRQENPEADWVVLRIKPQVLWEKDCLFCVENAATRAVAQTPLEQRRGLGALMHLFENIGSAPSRSDLNIPDHYPTHPQAEVLVMNKIEPDMILDVLVDKKERIRDYGRLSEIAKACVGGKKIFHSKQHFDARMDYAHWRGTQIG